MGMAPQRAVSTTRSAPMRQRSEDTRVLRMDYSLKACVALMSVRFWGPRSVFSVSLCPTMRIAGEAGMDYWVEEDATMCIRPCCGD